MKTAIKWILGAAAALLALAYWTEASETKQGLIGLGCVVGYCYWSLAKQIASGQEKTDRALENIYQTIRSRND